MNTNQTYNFTAECLESSQMHLCVIASYDTRIVQFCGTEIQTVPDTIQRSRFPLVDCQGILQILELYVGKSQIVSISCCSCIWYIIILVQNLYRKKKQNIIFYIYQKKYLVHRTVYQTRKFLRLSIILQGKSLCTSRVPDCTRHDPEQR